MPTDPERIRRARESLHWPRSVVAQLLRIQPYAVFAYERGDRSAPPGMVRWLEALAAAMERALKAHPPPPSPSARQGWQRRPVDSSADTGTDSAEESAATRIEEEADSASAAHCDSAALDSARLG